MKDVTVKAPAAEFFVSPNPTVEEIRKALEPPSKDEIIQAQGIEIRRLQSELAKLRVGASTIANATVCLTHMLGEERGHRLTEVLIPRALRNRLDGTQVQIRCDEMDDIHLSYVEANDVVFSGRPDE